MITSMLRRAQLTAGPTPGGLPPSPSWTLDFSSGEPWANGTNYTFSSTASTTRTFVNSSGFVAPCVANLLQRSEEFDNAYWTKSGLLAFGSGSTANAATAPDNTTTADLITESSGGTSGHYCLRTFGTFTANTSYTWSIFVKKPSSNARDFATLTLNGASGHNLVRSFDLGDGTSTQNSLTGANFSSAAGGSEDYGNGWWRLWIRVTIGGTAVTTGSVIVATSTSKTPTLASGAYPNQTGDGVSGILVWGAQLVEGSAHLPYSATTSSSNGIPRLTHNSSGSRLGLLVEGQRTNLVTYSADMSALATTGISVTPNTDTAPDNTLSADKITETSGSSPHALRTGPVTASAQTYTASGYLKNPSSGGRGYGFIGLYATGGVDTAYCAVVNLTNGQFETSFSGGSPSASYTITDVGNGWYRVSVTATAPSGTTGVRWRAGMWRSGAVNGVGANIGQPEYNAPSGSEQSILVWGAQLEAAATASSYIPTTATTVTRSADLAYVETADVTNWGRPGSFVVEYYPPLEQSGTIVVADDDGVGSVGRLGVEYSSGGPRIVYGTASTGTGGTPTAGLQKIAWAWDASGAATRSALNGSALDTSLATSFDPTLTDGINLGGNIDWTSLPLTVSGQPNVVIRKVQFYNSQLSAADLNTLTT